MNFGTQSKLVFQCKFRYKSTLSSLIPFAKVDMDEEQNTNALRLNYQMQKHDSQLWFILGCMCHTLGWRCVRHIKQEEAFLSPANLLIVSSHALMLLKRIDDGFILFLFCLLPDNFINAINKLDVRRAKWSKTFCLNINYRRQTLVSAESICGLLCLDR